VIDVLINIVVESWSVLGEMAPYLLLGFIVAGALSVAVSPETVERHLGGRGIMPVLKAALFGVPLPLCSCGVIPVATSLRRHGATRGATTSFLLSTPQTGVDSVMVTFSLLGWVFAVFRPLVALVTGLVGGSVVTLFERDSPARRDESLECHEACCTGDEGHGKLYRALRYAFVTLPQDIGKPLLVGLLVVGIISTAVPANYFADKLGTGLGAIVVMMLLGVPVYVCATASVPIAAAFIQTGISPGAALAFLMTGPATNAATIAVIWKTMGRRTALVYLGTVAVAALAAGTLLDYTFRVSGATVAPDMPWMVPGFVKTAAAVALVSILAIALVRPSAGHSRSEPAQDTGEQTTLSISGMHCSHCALAVQRALGECAGVRSVDVDLKRGTAAVTGQKVDVDSLCRAVDQLGYQARREQQV